MRLRASFADAELTQKQVATRSVREGRHGILTSVKTVETAMETTQASANVLVLDVMGLPTQLRVKRNEEIPRREDQGKEDRGEELMGSAHIHLLLQNPIRKVEIDRRKDTHLESVVRSHVHHSPPGVEMDSVHLTQEREDRRQMVDLGSKFPLLNTPHQRKWLRQTSSYRSRDRGTLSSTCSIRVRVKPN